jgi:UDP-3-O-[3-hydroxymyristoyl] N-acetylglucosamine deacetylase
VQTTLSTSLTFSDIGLHSGASVTLRIHPAAADHGIWIKRTDITIGDPLIAARWDNVEQTHLCTKLVNDLGCEVSTVEHVMAALAGCGVHNALIEVDGPEFPILDGSAVPFVRAILGAGVVALGVPVRAIRILAPVEFKTDQGWARFEPSDAPEMQFAIDFADRAIGKQSKSLNLSNGSFVRELCDSRTFCRNSDVETLRANGLALGGTLENAVVVDGDQILSPGGLRHADEAVRHKMLDALGDMALAGAPIIGRYVGHRAGHALTNSLLRAMFANSKCFEVVTCDHDTAALLPGAGAHLDEVCAIA